jgi:hypothetical protein
VVRGVAAAPAPPQPAGPTEREQRRTAQGALSHPLPAGLLPGAAVDGKDLRGARTATGGRAFLLGAISHVTGVVLGQRQIPDKKGEASQVETLLSGLDAAGMVFALDARRTTHRTARLITDGLQARYLLILEGNQPLTRAAAAVLTDADADWVATSATEDDRGHGRVERRQVRTTEVDDALFPGAQQAFRLRRDVAGWTASGTPRKSSTGSPPTRAGRPGAAQPLQHQRWTVENRLHWTRDVAFVEDKSQVRTGTAPRVLAGFGTWRSTPSGWRDAPRSLTPDATSTTTTTPSPPSTSDPKRSNRREITTPGP